MKVWNKYRVMLLFLTAIGVSGCFSGKAPLDVYFYEARPQNDNLIVFLRGMGGTFNCLIESHACFEEEGFVAAVRSRGLPYDMAAPDTHLGYYRDRTIEKRIASDVIEPARAAGYHKICVVGVSLGGLGALLYAKQHPQDIDGVYALGPYLGDKDIVAEIQNAGGLAEWSPGPYDPDQDWQRMLWDWLKRYPHAGAGSPPIYLGIAKDDVYYESHKLLADFLPPERTIFVEGKHRFSSFKNAWEIFLDRGLLK